jgi:hypothetical protein
MPRFFKPVAKSNKPSEAEIRRAKDLWTDVYHDSIVAQVAEAEATRKQPAGELVQYAAEVADAALDEMEKRWPKI